MYISPLSDNVERAVGPYFRGSAIGPHITKPKIYIE